MAKLNPGNLKPVTLVQAQAQVLSGEVSDEFADWWKKTMPNADPNHTLTARAMAWCAWCGCANQILVNLKNVRISLR
ncbi:hypothetical protein JW777_00755 [bacterium]|nr:hypothetical protein [bacterium]